MTAEDMLYAVAHVRGVPCERALRERALVLDPRPLTEPLPVDQQTCCNGGKAGCSCWYCIERERGDKGPGRLPADPGGYVIRAGVPLICEAPGYNMVIQLDDDPGPWALGWRAWGGPQLQAKRNARKVKGKR